MSSINNPNLDDSKCECNFCGRTFNENRIKTMCDVGGRKKDYRFICEDCLEEMVTCVCCNLLVDDENEFYFVDGMPLCEDCYLEFEEEGKVIQSEKETVTD